jgi:hypothetical protein
MGPPSALIRNRLICVLLERPGVLLCTRRRCNRLSDSEPTPLLPGETRWRESAHFGERLGNAIGLSLGKHCDRATGEPFLRNRPHLANQEIGVLVQLRPREDMRPKRVGGEFIVKRRSGSETDLDNAAAKRSY